MTRLTQTLQVHFVQLPPRSSNHGHGHQNEAAFYILEGKGYEVHDGERYDWAKDDLVLVHTDSVHRHFNPYDEQATALVMKAKCAWMYLGLIQQGRSGPLADADRFGPRVDWSQVWTPGVEKRRKVVKPVDTTWETTPLGRVRVLSALETTDVRTFSVDAFELEIPAGSRSGKRWHMADEILYVLGGQGYSLHWEVAADLDDKYYARIANEPTRHEIKAGDTLYVPQNTVAQHFSADGQPLRLLSGQNRLFKQLGYDRVAYLENAPEFGARPACGARSHRGDRVTTQGEQAAAAWRDTDFARDWALGDSFRDLLDFPRRMAAAIVAGDNPVPVTIVDVGAGPGAVLEVFLRRFPGARGIWTDASCAMLDLAQEKLAPFGDRVEYRIADMTDLDNAGLPDAGRRHHDLQGRPPPGPDRARRLLPGGRAAAGAGRLAGQPRPHRSGQPGGAARHGRVRRRVGQAAAGGAQGVRRLARRAEAPPQLPAHQRAGPPRRVRGGGRHRCRGALAGVLHLPVHGPHPRMSPSRRSEHGRPGLHEREETGQRPRC